MYVNHDLLICKVVAEAGINHNGDISIAKRMIETAKICDANFIKFQKRNPHISIPEDIKLKPHPSPWHSYGETYLDHKLKLEFTIEQHIELKQHCNYIGIQYCCSVWDMDSAKEIISISPSYIKIPSAHCLNFTLIEYVINNFSGDVHISTGMTTQDDKMKLRSWYGSKSVQDRSRIVIYHCTSIYPCPFEYLHIMELDRLKDTFGKDCRTGFSSHAFGIAADVVSTLFGIEYLERHFTLDRTMKGSDHAASVEPDGLKRITRDIKAVYKSLTYKDSISQEEIKQKEKLGFFSGK